MIEVEFSDKTFGQTLFNTNVVLCYSIKGLDSRLNCKIKNGFKNIVQITNGIVDRIIEPGRQIGFKINGVKNPAKSSTGNSSDIIVIRTISQNGYTIDKSG